MTEPDARLQRLLGGDALAALRQRLRRAYENSPLDAPPRRLHLVRLQAHEREALAALLGRAPRLAASMQLELPAIDTALQAAGLAAGLRAALEQLDGALGDRLAERAAHAAGWLAVQHSVSHAGLSGLLQLPQGLGLLRRLARQDSAVACTLCAQAQAVLQVLPAAGTPRARLAATQLGNAHALDDGQPLATLVLAALHAARADDAGAEPESRRAAWAAVGVSVNELARPALWLNLLRADGEPHYASLRQLLRCPPIWPRSERSVFVCENPNLVAIAADALGERCAPLVCTDGMPAAAQRALLAQLQGAGARLLYHGDFDWPGLVIAQRVLADFSAAPWRLGVADYRQALLDAPHHALRGSPQPSPWDPGLSAAMQRDNCAVAEESVAERLLGDLAAG